MAPRWREGLWYYDGGRARDTTVEGRLRDTTAEGGPVPPRRREGPRHHGGGRARRTRRSRGENRSKGPPTTTRATSPAGPRPGAHVRRGCLNDGAPPTAPGGKPSRRTVVTHPVPQPSSLRRPKPRGHRTRRRSLPGRGPGVRHSPVPPVGVKRDSRLPRSVPVGLCRTLSRPPLSGESDTEGVSGKGPGRDRPPCHTG